MLKKVVGDLDGQPFDVTLQDARRALELITAIYTSAESGQSESLPIGPPHPRYKGWYQYH